MGVLVYLDSSTIVKRYVKEKVVDLILGNAELGNIKIFFSIWNVGEVLGVLDKCMQKSHQHIWRCRQEAFVMLSLKADIRNLKT